MKKIIPIVALFMTTIFLSACEDEPRSPLEVTQAFWSAVETKDIRKIKKFITEKSLRDEYKTENIITVSNITFGKIIIDGKKAEVETNVTIESDNPVAVPIDTLLVNENDKWKVDYHATINSISQAGQLSQIFEELKGFGEQLTKGFENSMKELDKAMPEIERDISEFGDQIKKRVPELKKQFEDITRELERAWKESLEKEQKPESESI